MSVTSMHRPNWLKFTSWLVVPLAAPAPTVGSSENVWTLSYPPPHEPTTTGLPSTFALFTTRHRPLSEVPFVVPCRFWLSFVLHCCCGRVLVPQGWNLTGSWLIGARPASRHMPSGFDDVFDDTSVIARFGLYAKSCRLAPGVNGRITSGVPAAGAPPPASMQRSVLVTSL